MQVFEDRLKGPDEQGQAGQDQQLIVDIGDAEGADPRLLALDDDVHRRADEQGRGQIEDLVGDRAGAGQTQGPAVGRGVGEQSAERVG